jgi:hypothetical protein
MITLYAAATSFAADPLACRATLTECCRGAGCGRTAGMASTSSAGILLVNGSHILKFMGLPLTTSKE